MKRKSAAYILSFLATVTFGAGLIVFPSDTSAAVRNALDICFMNVVPSLFPFFIVSKLMVNLRFTDILNKTLSKVFPHLFSVRETGASALILGATGGYPVGATTCASMYQSGRCTKAEAERLISFCNMCGPGFIIGTVGFGVFKSSAMGILLYVIHVLSAVMTGVFLRIFAPLKQIESSREIPTKNTVPTFSFAFTDAVFSSLKSILSVCAYILLFSVITRITQIVLIMPTDASLLRGFMSGLLEITVGIFGISESTDFSAGFIFTAFLLGWGGLSVHCQTISCLAGSGLRLRTYFFGKLLHAFISAIFAFLVITSDIIQHDVPAMSYTSVPEANFTLLYFFSILLTALIFLFCKKGWKKEKK